MRAIAELIGWLFLALCLAGALIPGVCFHLLVGSKGNVLRWHKEAIARMEAAQAQPQKDSNQ